MSKQDGWALRALLWVKQAMTSILRMGRIDRPLEPGLLSTFRILMAVHVAFWLYEAAVQLSVPVSERSILGQSLLLLCASSILLGWLMWLDPKSRGSAKVLPVLLILSTLPLFLETYWRLGRYELTLEMANSSVGSLALTEDLILFLVLIAWQYHLRAVIVFEGVTTLIDLWLLRQFVTPGTLAFVSTVEELAYRTAGGLLIGYVIVRLMDQQRRHRHELQAAHAEQIALNAKLADHMSMVEQFTISQERNRLARELHDTLAHSLSALTVQLEAARVQWDRDPELARQMLKAADQTARLGLTESRRALQALRTSSLEALGLSQALRELVTHQAEQNAWHLTLKVDEVPVILSPSVEQGFYRVAQEVLENVMRHAEAHQVDFHFACQGAQLTLVVTDDGAGFEPAAISDTTRRWGIKGMRERTEMMGGTLDIQSQIQGGTRVTLTVNIQVTET